MIWKRKPLARDFTSQSRILSLLQHRPFQVLYYGKLAATHTSSYPSARQSIQGIVTGTQGIITSKPAQQPISEYASSVGHAFVPRGQGTVTYFKGRPIVTYTPTQTVLATVATAPARSGTRPPPDFSGAESTAAGRSAYIAKWGSF